MATITVLATALFPTGFFLFAPYTESLFLLLAVGSILMARTGRTWAAGVLGLLAGLTRTQGVFLVLPIAYEHLRQRGTDRWLVGRGGRPPGMALLAAAMPLGGLALFTLYQWNVVGEHQTGLDALAAWGYQIAWPWDALAAGWSYVTGGGHSQNGRLIEAFNLVALGGASAVLVFGAIGRRRLPAAYLLYAIPSLGLLFFREMWFSPLMSVGRYVLVVFPCFMVVGRLLATRPRLAIVTLAISGVLELVLLQYWVRWGFVA